MPASQQPTWETWLHQPTWLGRISECLLQFLSQIHGPGHCPMRKVRSCAKLHSKVFTDHGLVHPALLSSFSPKARKDGGSKPTNVDWISESLMFMKGLEHKVVLQTHSFWHVTYMLRIRTYGIDRGRGGARVSQVKSFFWVWLAQGYAYGGSNELICNPHALSICML